MKHLFNPYTLSCEKCDRSVNTLYDCTPPRKTKEQRKERKRSRPPRPPKDAWLICMRCPEDDNEWPATSFSHSLGSFRYGKVCNDCWKESYERCHAECSSCGKESRGRWRKKGSTSIYICRKCRKQD